MNKESKKSTKSISTSPSEKSKPTKATALSYPDSSSFKAYLKWVYSQPYLTEEEEKKLAARYRDEDDLAAAQKLVLSHLRVVVKQARPFFQTGIPIRDLIQHGTLGLMKAVKKYDSTRGVRLVTYAVHWIKAEIYSFLNRFRLSSQTVSIDSAPSEREDDPYFSSDYYVVDSESDPAKLYADEQGTIYERNLIRAALASLNERSRDIIEQRYLTDGKPATLKKLADRHGVSAERIRQIEKKALETLREVMKKADHSLD